MSEAGQTFLTKELRLRILSAIVMIAVTLIVTWVGDFSFRMLCAGIGAAVFYEWLKMAKAHSTAPERQLSGLLMATAGIIVLTAPGGALSFVMVGALAVLALFAAPMLGSTRWNAVGLAYASLAALSLALLRGGEVEGLKTVVFVFVVVWATDIMAYFVGRTFGGPKLAPAISPGKTWSGALGGTVFALVFGMFAAFMMETRLPVGALLVLIVALSVASQSGDLFESWLKRRFQVKDSSKLIPGHGGVMDRVDGLVAASLLLYVIGAVLADPDRPALAFF